MISGESEAGPIVHTSFVLFGESAMIVCWVGDYLAAFAN